MTRPITLAFALGLGLALSLGACKKDKADKPADKPADTSGAAKTDTGDKTAGKAPDTPPAGDAKPSPAANRAAEAIMAKYEACRAKLAGDLAELSECATEIAAAAETAGGDLAGAAKKAAGDIAAAAKTLAETGGDDIEKLRLAFGEVSKPVEQLLTATPEVAAKYKMYECPMAKGFKRWAQPDMGDAHAMANPYMGKKMLQCGSEVHDHHKGMSGGMDHEMSGHDMSGHDKH